MKKFIIQVVCLLILIIGFNSINPLLGLYKMYKFYPTPYEGSIKRTNFKTNYKKKILILGCSNLQHNIDYKKTQTNVNADLTFLRFSGSDNSSFLRLMKEKGLLKNYDYIVLYLPYHILKNAPFLHTNSYHFKRTGSFDYSLSCILHTPLSFFYNWNSYYDSLNFYRKPLFNGVYMDTHYINDDSLSPESKSYYACNEKFVHSKHIISIPNYTSEDSKFVNSIASKNQKLFVLFTPIPNIIENKQAIRLLEENYKKFFTSAINKPFLVDSTLFYDQWYHLNNCGRQIETKNMILNLNKILAE